MTRNNDTSNPNPGVPDTAALPVSVLSPEDANEAVCPRHGEMSGMGKQLVKNNGTVWIPQEGQELYVCGDCVEKMSAAVGASPGKFIAAHVYKIFQDYLKDDYVDTGLTPEEAKEKVGENNES